MWGPADLGYPWRAYLVMTLQITHSSMQVRRPPIYIWISQSHARKIQSFAFFPVWTPEQYMHVPCSHDWQSQSMPREHDYLAPVNHVCVQPVSTYHRVTWIWSRSATGHTPSQFSTALCDLEMVRDAVSIIPPVKVVVFSEILLIQAGYPSLTKIQNSGWRIIFPETTINSLKYFICLNMEEKQYNSWT